MKHLAENAREQTKFTGKERSKLKSKTYFTIKHLAEFSGIKPHTIRSWEQRFSFLRPQRTEASHRVYSPEQVNHFLQVCLLKQNGYRMNQISSMHPDKMSAAISGINGITKYTRTIHELIGTMATMDIIQFNNILDDCVNKWGIHETIKSVIIPFSERVGLFDNPEKRNYRQNIFLVLECIRQKIYLAIETISLRATAGKHLTVLLFLPGPIMELPLLYLHYLIKKEGFTTIYLGKHFSFDELDMICKKKKPDYVITHLPGNRRYTQFGEFARELSGHLPRTHFISTGKPLSPGKNAGNYRHLDNLTDIITTLDRSVV